MSQAQAGILQALPAHATYLSFTLSPQVTTAALAQALHQLHPLADGQRLVLGIGAPLAAAIGVTIAGLRDFVAIEASKMRLPATPAALWIWLREAERGELVHQQGRVQQALGAAFELSQQVAAFHYADGRDLSGYIDGTENPQDELAQEVAIAADGSSYVAVQQWQHRFERLAVLSEAAQDDLIGRHKADNEEFDSAPESAHVKRTAQESFTPPAFMLRRSMPWSEGARAGLQFVAFATSYAPFEAQLRRMSGAEDGVVDGLFQFSQPLTGNYFWCPPCINGRVALDWLSAV
ncbi:MULTISPECIES: Dyp-type peroxidase [unclassified Undibacterium]|uniref:Dyp-type peroxidase n=1 Tax=unclassified Undibacterium TaxID=2630295 RepID=UPI002AC9104C|nr:MULTISPECIES: Dyp-type peroxidase [unclassified Undibacterium]MEB0137811.1 Dyp-type peroxidase [Undibacterium sp. CCC2.1]MEB0170998.1 Dyp-type peroxidase [Undibacterium sp. CCC1.1]MEB0175043.1 Dyp-type peroxidase [Undibacterium sp. CCC3.4]MEB0215179.1 Dyp-type peroxidase [Undibacterium sp. 5I2]WPX44848.1 Dyp-type peroxidase [Undibacterium sp. CCC3.4]